MAGAGDVRAGGAYVELFAKDSSLQKGLAAAQTRLKNFGASFTAVGSKIAAVSAAAFAPIAGAVGLFVQTGDALDDMAQKTSITVESLSALRYVAELTGNSLEDMAKGLAKSQKLVSAAASGNKTAAQSLADLGLSAKDLIDLAPDELFAKIVDSLSKIDNPTKRAAASMEIFGKGAQNMAELIAKGGPEIERLTKQAQELGLIMSTEDAAAAAEFKDALYGLTQQVAFLVGSAFSGWLRETTEGLSKVATVTARVLKANRELVTTIGKVVAVGLALGAALVVLGVLFSSAAAVIGGIMGTLSAIGAIFGVVAGAIGFLASPIGIVVAGLVGLVAWFMTSTDAGRAMVSSLVAAWQQFAGEAMTSWGAIVEAIRAGDIEAAWRVVTSFLNLEWTKFVAFLQTSWAKWKGTFLKIWNDVTSDFAKGWNDAVTSVASTLSSIWGGLQVAFVETVAFLQQAWIGFVKFVRSNWNSASTWIGEVLAMALEKSGAVEAGTADAVRQMGAQIGKDIESGSAKSSNDAEVARARARVQIKEDANAREAGIMQQHAERMNKIEADRRKGETDIKTATDDVVAAQEAKVNEARDAWTAAVSAAKQAGADVDQTLLTPNTAPGRAAVQPNKRQQRQLGMLDDSSLSEGRRARIQRNLEKQGLDVGAARAGLNGTAGVSGAMDKISSKGTFNPMALQALAGGGGVADKQLAEQKKLAAKQDQANKTLEKIAENTNNRRGLSYK